jgi:hypothetical protein
MAITKFQPKIWSANILANLRAQLVYAGPGISNRDYEGDISAYGDTVHMVSFSDPAVRTYSKGGPITWDVLTDAENLLVVNQSDYFAFTVDDIDKRQALPGFIAKASQGASYNLVKNADAYVATNLLTAVNGSGNDLGLLSVTVAANDFYGKFFVGARTKLNKANVPYAGRWAVIPPDATGYLLQDPRFVANPQLAGSGMADVVNDGIIGDAGEQADSFSGDDMGANPLIGRIAGFNVYESNTVPVSGSAFHCMAGHPMAHTFADQISETEALRLQTEGFLDGIRGLHLYGGKVNYAAALALGTVTLA